MAIGFLLFIIPGFFVAAWTVTMPVIVMLERAGPVDAFGRGQELGRGSVLRILAIAGLTTLLVGIIQFAVSIGFGLLGGGSAHADGRTLIDLAVAIIALRILAVTAACHRIDDGADDAAILVGVGIGLLRSGGQSDRHNCRKAGRADEDI
jgi:hypothetical protein